MVKQQKVFDVDLSSYTGMSASRISALKGSKKKTEVWRYLAYVSAFLSKDGKITAKLLEAQEKISLLKKELKKEKGLPIKRKVDSPVEIVVSFDYLNRFTHKVPKGAYIYIRKGAKC